MIVASAIAAALVVLYIVRLFVGIVTYTPHADKVSTEHNTTAIEAYDMPNVQYSNYDASEWDAQWGGSRC